MVERTAVNRKVVGSNPAEDAYVKSFLVRIFKFQFGMTIVILFLFILFKTVNNWSIFLLI